MIWLPSLHRAFAGVKGWILLVICFDSVFWLLLFLHPLRYDKLVVVDDIFQCSGLLLAVILCLIYFRRQSVATSLVGLGILAFAAGQGISSYEELILRQSPFPSVADIAFFICYSIVLPGILRLSKRPLALVERLSVILDGMMIMTTIVVFSWHFVLRPTLLLHGSSLVATIIATAYPCFDLILLFCVLLLWMAPEDRKMNSGLLLLSLGLVMVAIVDSLFDYLNIYNMYATGNIIDPLWSLGYQCIALGVIVHQRAPRSVLPRPALLLRSRRSRQLFYTVFPVLSLLIFYIWRISQGEAFESEMYVGTTLLIGLILLRWIAARRKRQILNTNNCRSGVTDVQLETQGEIGSSEGLSG